MKAVLLSVIPALMLLCSCTPDSRMGMQVPSPETHPVAGTIPDGDPFNPDTPLPPPGPDIPDTDPARL